MKRIRMGGIRLEENRTRPESYYLNHCGKPVLREGAVPDNYSEPLRICKLPVLEIRDGKLVKSPEQILTFLVPGEVQHG